MKHKIKNIINSVFILISFLFIHTGCDYLDKEPDNIRTFDMIWETRADAEAYLYNIYGYIWVTLDDFSTLGVSDETSVPYGNVNARKIIEGNWNASSGIFDNWSTCYKGIRESLVFEANIDRVPSSILSDKLKVQYKAESKFLRGWFYWKLLQQYGPFVIITQPMGMSDDYDIYTRSPFDDCVTHICNLMDEAAGVLPDEWASSANYGRPSKGSCLAVKSQVLLLAASELWNGNTRFANFKNHDGTPLAPASYDPEKWKQAADAAKDVIDMNIHKLFTNLDEGDVDFDPYLSYRNVFLTNWNKEILFSTNISDSWQWGHEKRCAPNPGGYNMQNATQNIVDAFYTRNGKDIYDDASYMETGFATVDDPARYGFEQDQVNRGYSKGEWNMYVNREPRFYVNIQYNGRPVLPAPSVDDKNFFSSDANKDGRGRAEFYATGLSGAKTNNMPDVTGYCVLKRVSPETNIRIDKASYRPFIQIRYAEILLNYVEALNEYNPNDPDIKTYLNEVRTRAGIPGIEVAYPAALGKKEEMRKWIIRERQIELAFESDRYWTLCRRLLYELPENRTIQRMNVNADDGGQRFSFEGFYTRQRMPDRYWSNKMYLFPVSQYELDRGKGLVQNPGW
ncbi:hypothetical protein GGR21_000063 [Dysgonomonas hofstadii]|uniref:RagB/SusD family nutrient uptake outer membrane protein n=1 Tax=Dysgonomonas hofstadii TaxID=637886 RepID=A0A840CJI8_9BACT|nr:RagB/SusD family nutrient uptake outer membrane protein [Dysgonomonas hofstadii]MBB4034178.1 hypothetical protein [Dysgonomonas hofstadii]